MAFQKGNTLGSKARLFEQAIKSALGDGDRGRLRAIAANVVELAEAGERWAVEMIRDTLDGRPAQQIIPTDTEGRSLAIGLVAYAVRPNDPLQVLPEALPAPDTTEAGQRH